ncbi:hypothetical protein [Stutzerimonas stutzeri]|uniref:hypothetical protein n=1 Tax=Stutzerimonas stutzeri TaxID=316 RepID=UPI0015E3C51F|nr:hypothetical protein [Stutzerimonas stutzeri]MBA1280237.1 hypothetical protein [Stutzerimonas stutzeri]
MKPLQTGRCLIAATLLMGAVTAQAASDECVIDKMMRDNRVAMDKMAVGLYENGVKKPVNAAIDSAPNVKDASCLPMLDQLDTLMRMRIPSIGGAMGGLMTKIMDMACDMANSYLEQMANSVEIGYSDPLGIASVGIGGTTGGDGGAQIEEYDLSEVVGDAVMDSVGSAAGGAVRNSVGDLKNKLPTGPTNRQPQIDSTIRQEVKGAINGL